MVVPLKIKHPPEGVDSRNKMVIDGEVWNVSNFVNKINSKNITMLKAKNDTIKGGGADASPPFIKIKEVKNIVLWKIIKEKHLKLLAESKERQ